MSKKIPSWARRYVSTEDLKQIRELIQNVEQKTQVELVPLIIRSSIDLRLFRGLLILLAITLFLLIQIYFLSSNSWDASRALSLLDVLTGIGLLALAYWGSANVHIIRLFFGKQALQEKVYQRACSEFFENRLHTTESRTAVLFLYSVAERKAFILPDPNLSSFPTGLWHNAIEKMLNSAKKGHFFLGFSQALDLVASELAHHFPPHSSNKNEIPDTLIIKE